MHPQLYRGSATSVLPSGYPGRGVNALEPGDGDCSSTATFGAGGYTCAILEAPHSVLALDRDPEATAGALVGRYVPRPRLSTPFSDGGRGRTREDGGDRAGRRRARSRRLLHADRRGQRGFSFQTDGPLDMRMGRSGPTVADFLNAADEGEIARVVYELGEEKKSRVIARAIIRARARRPLARTLELADIVSSVLGPQRASGRHPATRTFQALRMHINNELEELEKALVAAEALLETGGRLVVVTFHSLEDRIVKRFLRDRAELRGAGASRHLPELRQQSPRFRIPNPRPVTPGEEEVKANPRARSAKLRAGERL